jgi:hypothetical protein
VRVHEVQLLQLALEDKFFVQVVNAGHGMMSPQGAASEHDAGHQESAQYDQSSGSCTHGCYSNILIAGRIVATCTPSRKACVRSK